MRRGQTPTRPRSLPWWRSSLCPAATSPTWWAGPTSLPTGVGGRTQVHLQYSPWERKRRDQEGKMIISCSSLCSFPIENFWSKVSKVGCNISVDQNSSGILLFIDRLWGSKMRGNTFLSNYVTLNCKPTEMLHGHSPFWKPKKHWYQLKLTKMIGYHIITRPTTKIRNSDIHTLIFITSEWKQLQTYPPPSTFLLCLPQLKIQPPREHGAKNCKYAFIQYTLC